MRPTIGIVKPGSTFPEMIARFGDYDTWFVRALEGADAEFRVHAWSAGDEPALGDADAWLVTGARSAVYDDDPAIARLVTWMARAVDAEVPLLGVCWGHQALCQAMGGTVRPHPGGWEIGTVEVTLTPEGREDPLFHGLPERFRVQTTHQDYVSAPPPGGVRLAGNDHTLWQAVAYGAAARGVQFHPEVTEPIAADFVARREHLLTKPAMVEDAPDGAKVLRNWVDRFVGQPPSRSRSRSRSSIS